jgi:hypothetical protein
MTTVPPASLAHGFTRRALVGAAAASVFAPRPGMAAGPFSGTSTGPFRRGVDIYHMMEGLNMTPEKGYILPPYQGADFEMPDAWMAELKAVGLDFVRLAVAPDIFLRTTGATRDQAVAQLLTNVTRFLAAGLEVIVDLHPGDRIPGYKQVDYVSRPITVQAYGEFIGEVAGLLSRFPVRRVALELLNEPHADRTRWPSTQKALHDKARRSAPRLALVLTGVQGLYSRLVDLDPSDYSGSNVYYTFHYYEPHVFTHQNIPDRQYLTGVPWPSSTGSYDKAMATVRANIAADKALSSGQAEAALKNAEKLLKDYFQTGSGAANVTADFNAVAQWARKYNIPSNRLIVGELGVNTTKNGAQGATFADRDRWISTVRRAAEANGYGWALWPYDGATGMSLISHDPERHMDAGLLSALGLAGGRR